MVKKILWIFLMVLSLELVAQEKYKISASDYDNEEVEMADKFREDGKIYVVVAVVLLVLGGLIAYVVITERKVSRIEKKVFDESK